MRQTRPLCLASGSPRRRELLAAYGLTFAVYAPEVDETPRAGEGPGVYVRRLAGLKARAGSAAFPGHVTLAGDTVVVLEGEVLGKPRDGADAAEMLRRLSGRRHQVLSAYAVRDPSSGAAFTRTVRTAVTFRPLPPAWIDWYAAQPEGRDKAGAYAVQGLGGAMVARLSGSFNNVVGFPIESIVWDLLERGWLTL